MGAIVLANYDDAKVYFDVQESVSSKIFTWVLPAIRAALTSPQATGKPDVSLDKYEGKYRNWLEDSQILVMNDELVLFNPLNPPVAADMTKLKRVGADTFRIEQKDGFGAPGETLTFSINQKGVVTGYSIAGNHAKRVLSW
jgi:hypothetical protein